MRASTAVETAIARRVLVHMGLTVRAQSQIASSHQNLTWSADSGPVTNDPIAQAAADVFSTLDGGTSRDSMAAFYGALANYDAAVDAAAAESEPDSDQ